MWQRVTREQLYEQVWSVPIWTLCEQYVLSDNGLRKACRRLNVPVPPRGYWAKVEAGHTVRQVAMPKEAKWTVTEIWREPGREKTPADEADAVWLKEWEAFEADPAHRIEVVPKPRRWSAAIAPLRESLEEEAKKIEAARKAQERYDRATDWQKQRDWASERMEWFWYERAGQLMPATHHASVVRLSLAEFRRGLAILNAVAVAATKRGFAVTLDGSKGRMVLEGNGGRLDLRMSEKTEQKTRRVERYDGKMEDERAEFARREAEEEALREAERKQREALVEEVAAWKRANEIRVYVAAVRAEIEKSGGEVKDEFVQWEDWALNVAKEGDPATARVRSALQGA